MLGPSIVPGAAVSEKIEGALYYMLTIKGALYYMLTDKMGLVVGILDGFCECWVHRLSMGLCQKKIRGALYYMLTIKGALYYMLTGRRVTEMNYFRKVASRIMFINKVSNVFIS